MTRLNQWRWWIAALLFACLLGTTTGCKRTSVSLLPERPEVWRRVEGQAGQQVGSQIGARQGDRIWTQNQGQGLLKWPDLWVRLYDDTDFHVEQLTPTGVWVALSTGTLLNGGVAKARDYVIQTGDSAEIRFTGTVAMVSYYPPERITVVRLFEGTAEVRNLTGASQAVTVREGQWAVVEHGRPPRVPVPDEDVRQFARLVGLWDTFHQAELDVRDGFGPQSSRLPAEVVEIVFTEQVATLTPVPTATRGLVIPTRVIPTLVRRVTSTPQPTSTPPLPRGVVRGRVLWNEQPVPEASVYVTEGPDVRTTHLGEGATDGEGWFFIRGIPEGQRYLFVVGNRDEFWVASLAQFTMPPTAGVWLPETYLCQGFHLLVPKDGEQLPSSPSLLRWEPVPGAVGYALRISSPNARGFVFQQGDDGNLIRDTALRMDQVLPPGEYSWRVDAFNAQGHIIGCSVPQTFVIIQVILK